MYNEPEGGMMLNLNSILLGSENPRKLIEFYKKVLNTQTDWGDGEWAGFKVGDGYLTVGPHSEVKGMNKDPGRILFNFETIPDKILEGFIDLRIVYFFKGFIHGFF